MIKSVINEQEKEKGNSFPRLMIGSSSGCIILFSSDRCGVILNAGDNENLKVGHKSKTWDMNYFNNFNKSITLTNGGE